VPDSAASAALPKAYRGGEISSKNRARAEMREDRRLAREDISTRSYRVSRFNFYSANTEPFTVYYNK